MKNTNQTPAVGHTPGPWSIVGHAFPGLNREDRPLIDACGDTLGVVRGSGVVASIRDANARLISAAPDLLAACEELLDGIERWDEAMSKLVDVSKLPKWAGKDRARAAIAKAKGGVA